MSILILRLNNLFLANNLQILYLKSEFKYFSRKTILFLKKTRLLIYSNNLIYFFRSNVDNLLYHIENTIIGTSFL